jgi:hypothetical protein
VAIKKISKSTQKSINSTIDEIFEKLKLQFLGPGHAKVGKGMLFHYDPQKTIGNMVVQSAYSANYQPNNQLKDTLEDIAASYIDATKERYRAKIMHAIQSGVTAAATLEDVSNSLQEILASANSDVKRILESETTTARSLSSIDALGKVAASRGVEDPVLFWITVKDNVTCTHCKEMYLMPDGIIPRLWRQSELSHGYWKKGMKSPCLGALHPNCRCVPTILMPGYGFNDSGNVTYISPNHDELKKQRGLSE